MISNVKWKTEISLYRRNIFQVIFSVFSLSRFFNLSLARRSRRPDIHLPSRGICFPSRKIEFGSTRQPRNTNNGMQRLAFTQSPTNARPAGKISFWQKTMLAGQLRLCCLFCLINSFKRRTATVNRQKIFHKFPCHRYCRHVAIAALHHLRVNLSQTGVPSG